jgi:hypothetical protein
MDGLYWGECLMSQWIIRFCRGWVLANFGGICLKALNLYKSPYLCGLFLNGCHISKNIIPSE